MGPKKSFFVLYSLLGDMFPAMYRTKTTCMKHIKKNPHFKFA